MKMIRQTAATQLAQACRLARTATIQKFMQAIYVLLFAMFSFTHSFCQAPKGFNYQAVLRDASGNVRAEVSAEIKISILQGSTSGASVYSETHNTLTNKMGIINLVAGSKDEPRFAEINWANGPYFIKIEVDGDEMGTSQLLSVPYALYAASGVGEPGLQGEKGEQGDRGIQGEQGETGPQGPEGEKGDQGIQGTQGPKGDKGDKGDQGIQGPKGDRGPQGIQGETGPMGLPATDASDLKTGELSTDRYNAYVDLLLAGNLNNDSPLSILLQMQADDRYSKGIAFFACNSVDDDYTAEMFVGQKVQFDIEKFDNGACFDHSKSRFVAPIDGIYHFSSHVSFYIHKSASYNYLRCYVNGVFYCIMSFNSEGYTSGINGAVTLKLNKGNYVDIRLDVVNDTYADPVIHGYWGSDDVPATYFSGHLVCPIY